MEIKIRFRSDKIFEKRNGNSYVSRKRGMKTFKQYLQKMPGNFIV